MGIPGGAAGTLATLKLMRLLVQKGKIESRPLALQLTAGLKQKDFRGEIDRLFSYVRDNIRYVKDINGTETVHDVPHILAQGAGDCDDKSILLASLLESIGHPTRFVAIGEQPGSYCHVFVETRIGKGWIPLETTEPVAAGWSYPVKSQRLVYPPMTGA